MKLLSLLFIAPIEAKNRDDSRRPICLTWRNNNNGAIFCKLPQRKKGRDHSQTEGILLLFLAWQLSKAYQKPSLMIFISLSGQGLVARRLGTKTNHRCFVCYAEESRSKRKQKRKRKVERVCVWVCCLACAEKWQSVVPVKSNQQRCPLVVVVVAFLPFFSTFLFCSDRVFLFVFVFVFSKKKKSDSCE